MVSVLNLSRGTASSPVVFLSKILYAHSVCLLPGVKTPCISELLGLCDTILVGCLRFQGEYCTSRFMLEREREVPALMNLLCLACSPISFLDLTLRRKFLVYFVALSPSGLSDRI